MSLTPRLTLIGMYNYDSDLFHLLSLPDGMDKTLFINSLLMRYGENPVVFPTVPFFKQAVGVWSAKWYDTLSRLYDIITAEYNPLYNYDQHKDYTDTEQREKEGTDRLTKNGTDTLTKNGTDTLTKNETITDSGTESSEYVTDTNTTGTEENTISAENVDTYQPDNKKTDEGTLDSTVTGEVTKGNSRTSSGTDSRITSGTDSRTTSGTDSRTTSGTDDRTLNHNEHLYGLSGNIGTPNFQDLVHDEIELRKDLSIYDVAAELFYKEFCLYVY